MQEKRKKGVAMAMAMTMAMWLVLHVLMLMAMVLHADADAAEDAGGDGEEQCKTVVVKSAELFCMFLPLPLKGVAADDNIISNAFCSDPTLINDTSSCSLFPPPPFIRTSFFDTNNDDGFVQVTGTFNATLIFTNYSDHSFHDIIEYDINTRGGGATCKGYPYFLNILEPQDNIFCIRCCRNFHDCPTSRAHEGCRNLIPGQYGNYP